MKKVIAKLLIGVISFTSLWNISACSFLDDSTGNLSSNSIEESVESSESSSEVESSVDTSEEDKTIRLEEDVAYLSLLNGGSFVNQQQISVLYAPSVMSYSSDDTNVAVVDDKGLVTAVGIGETIITIEGEGFEPLIFKVQVASGIIQSKADLDYIANAYKENNLSLWDKSNYYTLACDIDYQGETFTPIAPLSASLFEGEWGVFGELNNGETFASTIDGKGHSISNAVIPFGTVLCENYGAAGAFIGDFSGTMKNIAFRNIKTQNVLDFKAQYPETSFTGTWDVNQMQGIVSVCSGIVENVYAEMFLQTAACGFDATAGGLVAKVLEDGIVRCCITVIEISDTSVWDAGVVGHFWNGLNGELQGHPSFDDYNYLSDVGLIVGTNNGLLENCYTLVSQEKVKKEGHTSVYPYLPMFYGGFYSGWQAGPDYTYGMGSGTFKNLARYKDLADFIGNTSDIALQKQGFNLDMWNIWWGIL